jgi:response regulator RpfG family c-di-GMP phosphodiesterase
MPMSKPSIKSLTVKSIINFLLILSIITVVIAAINFREMSKTAIQNQALAHAKLVRAGLTAHMKGGIMEKRDYYLQEIRELNEINQLHIVRGQPVIDQFGAGKDVEKWSDDINIEVFNTKQPVFILNEFTLTPTVRAIIPYIATSEGALNCLNCHEVEEGTVLGAVDIEIDVSDYQRWAMVVIVSIFLTITIILVLMLFNAARTIQRYVQEPLESLVANASLAYKHHQPVCPDQFATREFTNVAKEINLFNNDIIAHQDMLHQKNKELEVLNHEIESTLRETVYTMGVIEEQRSKETNNHTKRVTLYCRLMAQKLGLSEHETDLVAAAAPLHDIGKLGIPDHILLKPAPLDDEEYRVMKNHTLIGYTMLSHSQRDILKSAGIIALQHHEKWNGSGYPQGLKGEEIHIFGRITALADVFDALYSPRVYKKAWTLDAVTRWIESQSGKHFDPHLVELFLRDIDEFVEIYHRYPSGAPEDATP